MMILHSFGHSIHSIRLFDSPFYSRDLRAETRDERRGDEQERSKEQESAGRTVVERPSLLGSRGPLLLLHSCGYLYSYYRYEYV